MLLATLAALLLGLPLPTIATNHILREDGLMTGLNGDVTIQFIQITVADGTQKRWGPQSGESASRAMLVFFDSAGLETGRFFFPSNPPAGANTVLIATPRFAALAGAPRPDFIVPPLLSPVGGKVCFRGNPANPFAFNVNLCLSYGIFPPDQTEGAGPPAPAPPVSGEPAGLVRFQDFSFSGATRNADFAVLSPSPANTQGATTVFAVDGPEINTSPAIVDFGERNPDLGPTPTRSLTITNRGVLNSLVLGSVVVVGTNANQFNVVSDTGQTTLPPGGSRVVGLTFDPSTPGRKVAVLRIFSNDADEPMTDVPLQGVGVDPNAPEIEVTPLELDMGTQNIAAGSPPRTVTVVNRGTIGTLHLGGFALVGPQARDFVILNSTNQSDLVPGGSRIIGISFQPTSAGPKKASLRIFSNDTDEGVVDVALSGRAFDLNPCTAPNPTNSVAQDGGLDAQLVCPGFVSTGTTLGASVDGVSTCGALAPDVWFRYVPASTGALTVTVIGVGLTPTLSAHSSSPGVVTNQLACAAAVQQPEGAVATISLPVSAQTPVFLRVAGVSAPSGSFQLSLTGPPCFDFDQNHNGVTDSCEFDFGDAPAPYPTTLAADGARHRAFTPVFLGQRVDPEPDGKPSSRAVGDNLDGLANDEDGVTLLGPLVLGQSTAVQVVASAPGFLNAWLDFNGDGDWSDTGEQIFVNQALVAGANTLSIAVPANAKATNATYARFRFGSTAGLSFVGPAIDGEVEDYVVEILSPTPTPGGLAVRFKEILAGLNGDSSIQYVELEATGETNKAWGPQGRELAGRAMLAFFDPAGNQIGRFVFPSNAPAGADTVLVATRAFADLTGLAPDFIMPTELMPISGKVVFQQNPDNRRFDVRIALAYGGNGYFGLTDGAGSANTNELPILGATGLQRVEDVPFGLNRNSAFQAGPPAPRNTAGQTFAFVAASQVEQGRTLFVRETFRGNGRTCATCHVPGRDQFGLTPLTIVHLPDDDPLFVFRRNAATLRLTSRSQPSDLRGHLISETGQADVLAGSGDTYFVVGDADLSGVISDENGNVGAVSVLTPSDLAGPTASNGSARGLEDHEMLEHGRGLVLENIDGFRRAEVFRSSPHLLNLALTAPYGLSGEFSTLQDFSDGAVVQHFPRSLARTGGVDFRHPTQAELDALAAFMLSISNPSIDRLDLDRLATTEAQRRGRALFFGPLGRCSACHSGPVLATSDGSLSSSTEGHNDRFNTGVANLPENLADLDNLPTEPAGLVSGQSTREFSTPSLFNIRLTAPFFHDASVATLTDAVKFYDTEAFHNSPAGQEVGSLLAANKPELIADLVAFLEALIDLPVDYPREAAFGVLCPGMPTPTPITITFTNIGATPITITNRTLIGDHPGEFTILSDSGEAELAPGATRTVQLGFNPLAPGRKEASLEFTAVDTNLLGSFAFGVRLTGAELDNRVSATPDAINFGTRDIDAPPSPEQSIVVFNDGSTDLDLLSVEFVGANVADFLFVGETNAIPAHGSRAFSVAFTPQTQGSKSALLRLRMVSCTGNLIEIPLTGVASASVHHFAWESVAGTQFVGLPFPIHVTATDRNGEAVRGFTGTTRFFTASASQTNPVPGLPGISGPFTLGVWSGTMTMTQELALIRLLAQDNSGHGGLSEPFLTLAHDDLSLVVLDSPDPLTGGQPLTYSATVRNTGPADSTGVVLIDQLAPGLNFVSANVSQGTVTPSNRTVRCDLGTLQRGASATVTLVVDPDPAIPAISYTNIASVSRNEPEVNLANNVATNTTAGVPIGLLSVTPTTDFLSAGLTGGPFTPSSLTYVLSNTGSATLSWQLQTTNCSAPQGLAALWPMDGNGRDVVGNAHLAFTGATNFAPAVVGQGLVLNGATMGRATASSALDVGAGSGFSVEAWINPTDANGLGDIVEWNNNQGVIGAHISTSTQHPGDLFANLVDTAGTSHQVFSAGGTLQSGVFQHIALTFDITSGAAFLYRNGVIVAQTNLGIFRPQTTFDFFVGNRPSGVFQGIFFLGGIDELGLYPRVLTADEVSAIFNARSSVRCLTPPWLDVSARQGSLAPGAFANVTMSISPNALLLPIGTSSDLLTFTNLTNGRGSTQRAVALAIINRTPTVNVPSSVSILEDSGPRTVNLTGITAGGAETQNLLVFALSSDSTLLTTPGVSYLSPATTGSLTFSPLPNASGTGIISVVVRDDGGTLNGAVASVTNTIQVTVLPVNDAPILAPIPTTVLHRGSTILITNQATDIDRPPDILTFSLLNPPTGATIDSNNGVLTFTADPARPLGSNQVTVVVRDNGTPSLSATNRYMIVVVEPLVVQASLTAPNTLRLTWPSIAGRSYRVQFKSELTATNWNDLPGDISAAGSVATKTDVLAGASQRFYRVQLRP
jgi:uncharacterized repeat protein (TIGR01451 family)